MARAIDFFKKLNTIHLAQNFDQLPLVKMTLGFDQAFTDYTDAIYERYEQRSTN